MREVLTYSELREIIVKIDCEFTTATIAAYIKNNTNYYITSGEISPFLKQAIKKGIIEKTSRVVKCKNGLKRVYKLKNKTEIKI